MSSHDPCAGCGAPLDERQRYCVVCGESRRHPDDPVARYQRGRRAPVLAAAAPVAPPVATRGDTRFLALALALLPLAAAAGVLAGRGGADHSDKVLAAIRASDARAAKVAAAVPVASAAPVAAAATVHNDFTRAHGWVVRLKPLTAAAAADPPAGTHVLVTKGFALEPATTAAYVLYAGPYGSKAAAARARKRLRARYPDATVVEVRRPSAATSKGGRAARIAAEDAVVRRHPTAKQKADGAKIVQQIQAKRGKSYVEQQQQLPDTIVIP